MSHTTYFQRQSGFSLIETIMVLALVGVGVTVMLYWKAQADDSQKATEAKTALTSMVDRIGNTLSANGNYSAVTSANVIRAGLVKEPYTVAGNNILDPWGNTVTLFGAPAAFGLVLQFPDQEVCSSFVSAFARSAVRINGGATVTPQANATTIAALFTGGTDIKAAPTAAYNPTNAATVCQTTTNSVGFAFR